MRGPRGVWIHGVRLTSDLQRHAHELQESHRGVEGDMWSFPALKFTDEARTDLCLRGELSDGEVVCLPSGSELGSEVQDELSVTRHKRNMHADCLQSILLCMLAPSGRPPGSAGEAATV